MKHAKRMLAVLLTLALGLSLGVPAFAAEAPVYGGPYAPIITKKPIMHDGTYYIGDTLIFEVEAELPEGVDGELSYAWSYRNMNKSNYIPVATGSRLELTITKDMTEPLRLYDGLFVRVDITNNYIDENGEEQTAYRRHENSYSIHLGRKTQWWQWVILVLLSPVLLPLVLAFFILGPIIGSFAFLAWIGQIISIVAAIFIPVWILNLLGLISQ